MKKVTIVTSVVLVTDNVTATVEATKRMEEDIALEVGNTRSRHDVNEKLLHAKVDVTISEGDYNE